MPFGFSSLSNSSRTSQEPTASSNPNSTRIPHLNPQPATSHGRISRAQSTKDRQLIVENSSSSLPRSIKPRNSVGGDARTGNGIRSSSTLGTVSTRGRYSSDMNDSIGRTSRTRDLIDRDHFSVENRRSIRGGVNGRISRSSDEGGGRKESFERANEMLLGSPIETPSPSPPKDMMQTMGRPRNIERSSESLLSAQTYLQSSENSDTNSNMNAHQASNRQRSESSDVVQKSNSISKPNKSKTNLLWRLRSPSKGKDAGSRARDQSQSRNSAGGSSNSPPRAIDSTNRTKTSIKTALNLDPTGSNEVGPTVRLDQESNFSPVSVLRSRSTVNRSKSSAPTRKNKEKDVDKDRSEGEGELRGMSRSWSTDLPKSTRKLVSNGLVLPSVKYPIPIPSPLPSPLPLVPDQDISIWAGNHERTTDIRPSDFDSTTDAPEAPVTATTKLSALQSPSRVPRISATFGSRANGADIPIPIFLNGILKTNYSRPIHDRSLSHQSTASSVSSSPSAAALTASESVPKLTTNNNYGNGQREKRRNSISLPSATNPTVISGSTHRPGLIRSNTSFDTSNRASIHDGNQETSISKSPSVGWNSPRNSSSSRHSSISTNSSTTSSSVKDSNGQQPSSNYSTARFLRFSDLFPIPPDHPPFVRSRSNKEEALTSTSTPIMVEGDLSPQLTETRPEEIKQRSENKFLDPDDVSAKEKDCAEATKSELKDNPTPAGADGSLEWRDLEGGLYVRVSCVKHGHSCVTSEEDSTRTNSIEAEEDEEEEEIVWKVVIRKKRPARPLDVNLHNDQTFHQELERRNALGLSLNSSTNTATTATTLSSSKTLGSSVGLNTPGQTPTKRTTTNNLYSVSPLQPTEAISPSTNNTLSLTLSLSPSTFSTTSGRLTFLPIPSLAPPSPIKKNFPLSRSIMSSSPTSLASFTGSWSKGQIDGKQKRSPGRNHIRTRSEFGQGWSGRSSPKGSVPRSHERTWSDIGMGSRKGLSASPKHYSLKDLVGGSE